MNKFDTIGIDLLSAAANDILVMGAKPLTFLDYIANDKLKPEIIKEIVSGMVKACRETGVSLVGGETAEMPDTYLPGEHDLVGIITGIVEKDKIITGEKIEPGDVLYCDCTSSKPEQQFKVGHRFVKNHPVWTIDYDKKVFFWHRPPYSNDPIWEDHEIIGNIPANPLQNTEHNLYFDCFSAFPKDPHTARSKDQN